MPESSRALVVVQLGAMGSILALGALLFTSRSAPRVAVPLHAVADERVSLDRRTAEWTAEGVAQTAREAALASIEPNIGQPYELETVLNELVQLAADTLQVTGASVFLRDLMSDNFVCLAMTPSMLPIKSHVAALRQKSGVTRWIIDHHSPLVVADCEDAAVLSSLPLPINPAFAETGLRAFAGVPLTAQSDVIGVLYVLNSSPRDYSQAEQDFLLALARRGALAVANVRLYETMQQANQELARASKVKDDFLASMSHELRTPLNAILGMSESLQEEIYGPVADEQRYPIQVIQESGRHLLAMINDILDFSRIEAGQVEPNFEPVHIPSLCRDSLQSAYPLAIQKQIKIKMCMTDDVQNAANGVWADERRLKQSLDNLLNNAVKFTHQGGEIGLDIAYDLTGETIRFDVWDTGIGIAQENLPRLFQPFAQLDSSLNRQYNGTGLGLALVMRMVDMHCGVVTVESQLGIGSRFSMVLPCQPHLHQDEGPLSAYLNGVAE